MRWPWSRRAAPAAEPLALALAAIGASVGDVAKLGTSGIGGFVPSVAPPPQTKPAGADGVAIVGGFVVSGERDPRLTGSQKWTTYDNQLLNVAVIGAAVNVWTRLGGSAKWTAEPNRAGGPGADLGVKIVTEGLLEAQLSTPWEQIIRRQLIKVFRGFAMHEVMLRRRSDDMIVVADIQDRPQWTVQRWNRPDPRGPWVGVEQQTMIGSGTAPYYIPRERLFYSVENTLSPSPEGVGLLRLTAESVRVLELYQKWEGIGFQTDLRGMPVARAPLAKLVEQARASGLKTDAEIRAFVTTETNMLVNFLSGHNKTAEQGVMLDSATYISKDAAQSPSSIYEWAFDLIQGSGSGTAEVGTAISRIIRDIARVMCAEWLLLGGEDSGGAYSMHEDKTAMFGLVVNSALGDLASDATRDIAARLVAMNGLDPETCTPRLVPEPVAAGAVKDACQALATLAQAALDPRDKAINVLRSRLDLPPAPDPYDVGLVLPVGVAEVGPDGQPVEVLVPPADGRPGSSSPPVAQPAADGEAGNPNARPDAGDGAPKEAA